MPGVDATPLIAVHQVSSLAMSIDERASVQAAAADSAPPVSTVDARRPRWWAQLAAAVAFYLVYAQIRDLHGQLSMHDQTSIARRHGLAILQAERWLHVALEHPIQRALLHIRPLVVTMNVFYGTFHFLATVAIFALLLAVAPATVFRRARNLLAVVTGLALVGFALYPTMPPRLLPTSYGYTDTLARIGGLWSYNGGVIEHIADPYAAMPSLHIAWATWCAVALAMLSRRHWQRLLLAGYPVLTAITVIATGAHWLLDLVAGELLLALAWVIVTHGPHLLRLVTGRPPFQPPVASGSGASEPPAAPAGKTMLPTPTSAATTTVTGTPPTQPEGRR